MNVDQAIIRSAKTGSAAILALLLSAVTINYIDRGSLSVAAPAISREFSISTVEKGWLLAAFFWSYSLCQIPAGWLVDRFNVKWVYAVAFLLWSLATAATGCLTSFKALFLMRLLLGIGESVNLPAVGSILARVVPEQHRGFANGLVDAGTKIGPGLSTLLGGLLVSAVGWRGLFLVLGLAGLLWLLPWVWFMPTRPTPNRRATAVTPSLLRILKHREAWGTALGTFALGYVWGFLLTWLPSYLVDERGLSQRQMAIFGSLPFWGMAVTSIAGGWLSDLWIRHGGSPTLVRKTFLIVGLLLCATLLVPVDLVRSSSASLMLLVAASVSLGIFTSNVWAVTQTLAGPAAAGKWVGLQNCIGNMGPMISPALTGKIVQRTHSYFLAFATASAVLLVGMVMYLLLVRKVAPVTWEEA